MVPIFYCAGFISLSKEDGGVRPIAIGNTIRPLAGKVAMSKMVKWSGYPYYYLRLWFEGWTQVTPTTAIQIWQKAPCLKAGHIAERIGYNLVHFSSPVWYYTLLENVTFSLSLVLTAAILQNIVAWENRKFAQKIFDKIKSWTKLYTTRESESEHSLAVL